LWTVHHKTQQDATEHTRLLDHLLLPRAPASGTSRYTVKRPCMMQDQSVRVTENSTENDRKKSINSIDRAALSIGQFHRGVIILV
jgi:hypothetical protein